MKSSKIPPFCEPAVAPLPDQTSPPPRILVVDDDGDTRFLTNKVLTDSGYHVHTAENGAVAWDTIQKTSYDLVITDNNMPKVTGVELLKKLHAARMAVPIILATGSLPQDEFTRHPWLRPTAVLLKPFDIEDLLDAVKQVLSAAEFVREQAMTAPDSLSPPPADGLQ